MDKNKKSNTAEILEQLTAGVQSVYESDAWKHYLSFVGKFRHYSYSNVLLIALQAPETDFVASFSDWKNKFNRRILPKSKAIRIIAPHSVKEEMPDGSERIYTGFHTASVFPIESTAPISEGHGDIPEICRTLDVPLDNPQRLINILVDISPVPVSIEDFEGSAYGYYSPSELKIVVKNLPDSQTVKTLIHEIGHSLIHCTDGEYEKVDKATKEIQAESIAFAVSQFIGLDTSSYSFPYVASFAQGKDVKELKAIMATIQKTAVQIMDAIEERLSNDEPAYPHTA